jgi:hypothetical protein
VSGIGAKRKKAHVLRPFKPFDLAFSTELSTRSVERHFLASRSASARFSLPDNDRNSVHLPGTRACGRERGKPGLGIDV